MNKAIFLDRDGVINEVLNDRVKFVNKPEDFHLLDGVGEAIHTLNEANYFVFVVTNQGGIGLGYMKEKDLSDIHQKMYDDLRVFNAVIDETKYCHHKPDAGCSCRKPHPKMIVELAKKYNIDLSESYMVGDREPDILAGKYAGAKTVFVGTREKSIASDGAFDDLRSFANWLTLK